jgi:hypothetical protein
MAEILYNSPWHNPFLAFVAGFGVLLLAARRVAFFQGFMLLFAFEIVADALLTGGLKLADDRSWSMPVAITFVVFGDWRYFVLIERYSRGGEKASISPWPVLAISMGWALMVPVLQRVVAPLANAIAPAHATDLRLTFLTYEALFAVLAVVLLAFVLPRRLRKVSPPIRRWLVSLTVFELVQYVLWASADVLILAGGSSGSLREIGFGLRIVPNLMYYAAFLLFAWRSCPREIIDPSTDEVSPAEPSSAAEVAEARR